MCSQILPTSDGYRYDPTVSNLMMANQVAKVIGVLPYGQTRTRCPPGVEDVGVWAGIGTYPFQEVENQSFNRV